MNSLIYRKEGTLLISDLIFLVLALSFAAILFVFIARQTTNTGALEETSAKQIAMLIDSAQPGTTITFFIGDISKNSKDYSGEMIRVDHKSRTVSVQLSEKGGYSYGYFYGGDVESKIAGEYLVLEMKK